MYSLLLDFFSSKFKIMSSTSSRVYILLLFVGLRVPIKRFYKKTHVKREQLQLIHIGTQKCIYSGDIDSKYNNLSSMFFNRTKTSLDVAVDIFNCVSKFCNRSSTPLCGIYFVRYLRSFWSLLKLLYTRFTEI